MLGGIMMKEGRQSRVPSPTPPTKAKSSASVPTPPRPPPSTPPPPQERTRTRIKVPDGAAPGAQLRIQTPDGPMLVTVPNGMVAGQSFDVDLPSKPPPSAPPSPPPSPPQDEQAEELLALQVAKIREVLSIETVVDTKKAREAVVVIAEAHEILGLEPEGSLHEQAAMILQSLDEDVSVDKAASAAEEKPSSSSGTAYSSATAPSFMLDLPAAPALPSKPAAMPLAQVSKVGELSEVELAAKKKLETHELEVQKSVTQKITLEVEALNETFQRQITDAMTIRYALFNGVLVSHLAAQTLH